MKMTQRQMRKARRAKRLEVVTQINLVSMIDIFTILIIYLLVNTAAVQVIGAEAVDLPSSMAEEQPRETVAVIVSGEDILVDGVAAMKIAEAEASTTAVLPSLKSRLLETASLIPVQGGTPGQMTRGEVNIMADKNIPYALLKKVMKTCADARFARISLAVIQENPGG